MANVRVLTDRLINKIAAGEVVERPASVLKELLENSLDAGAKELRIGIEAGGKRVVRVVDDGEGMDGDDVLLALERHATSKIRDFDDLEEVGTLGFRGEALPSIAAVSRMVLRSRPRHLEAGREATVEGGVIKNVRPCAMAPGTAVEVLSLFYNVPARRKFLRTTATEYAHCQKVASHYALAYPEISLRLEHNGAEQIAAPPVGSVRERIAQVLSPNLLDRLIPFEESTEDIRVIGFVSEPSLHRADTSMLHFFVNRRSVRDKVLIHALRAAYEDLLPKRRAPVAFLFLEMPAKGVDVNVHPSKTEIRFRQPTRVHGLVAGAVREALSRAQPLAPLAAEKVLKKAATEKPGDPAATMESLDRALKGRNEQRACAIDFRELSQVVPLGDKACAAPAAGTSKKPAFPEEDVTASQSKRVVEQTVEPEPQRFRGGEIDPEEVAPLGQVQNSYIIAQFPGGLMIVDQHAAHERILYEQLQKSAGAIPASQRLLHPLIVDLPTAQARLVEESSGLLAELGFDVEPFGPSSIALRALPASLETAEAEEILTSMAADLERLGNAPPERLRRELVISASCKGAIKVNTPLSREKMRWLLDALFSCEMPMRCPHGRPVVLTLGENELRRRFGRS